VATRVLVKGEAVAAPKGRADDFGWGARREGARQAVPDQAAPQAVTVVPEATPVPAVSQPLQERDVGKKSAPGKQASQPEQPSPAKKPKPAAAVPRPPASVGANNGGFVPFGGAR
jgi:hypothetical protein